MVFWSYRYICIKFALDERYNIIPDIISGMQKGWNPNTRTITLRMNNQKMDIKVDEINFYEREEMIARKLEDIKTIFSDKVKVDIPMVDKALSFNENIIKIEKFILPDIDKKNKEIYIATTEDNKIYVINDFTKIGNISNIPIMRFIGQTKDITYSDKIGNLESGNVYTTLSEKRIESKILSEILKNITSSINQDSLNYAINQYKGSQNYDGESIEEIKDIILSNAAKEKYNSMSESEKEHIKNEILKKEDRIVISNKDNLPLVSLLRSNDNCIYMADSKLIYSKKEKGIFNDLYEIIKNNTEKQNFSVLDELEQNLSDNQNVENNSPKYEEKNEQTEKEQQVFQHNDVEKLQINNYMKTRIKTLTNIQISDNKGYAGNGEIVLKSRQELQSEKDKMIEIIEDLYFNNRIDSNEKIKLIQFIAEEYKNMILNAPNLINNSLDNNESKYDEMLDEIENLTDNQNKEEEKKSKLTPEQMEKIVSDFGKWYEQNNEENETLNNQQNNNAINSPKYEEKTEQIDNVPNEFKVAYNNVIYNYLLEKYKFEKGYEYMNEEQKEEFDYVFESERASQEKNESKEFIQERKKSWDKIKQLLINNPNLDLETIIKQVEFNDYDKMDENEYSDESDKDIVENVERTGKRSFR